MPTLASVRWALPLAIVVLNMATHARQPAFNEKQLTPGSLMFERIVIDADFPNAYQVEVADINGDGKPDIVVVGGGTCAWYENPSWKKRIITGPSQTPGIISSATADVDGDGRAEVAIAYEFEMNQPTRGRLVLASQGASLDDPWQLSEIDPSQANLASIHRLRWGRFAGNGSLGLVMAPIFGAKGIPPHYQGQARLSLYLPDKRDRADAFSLSTHALEQSRKVLHAIAVVDADGDGIDEILTADNEGVALVKPPSQEFRTWKFRSLVAGASGPAPARGCSEVHLGRYHDGRRFLTTIEPWHGNRVVVYPESAEHSLNFETRAVIDDSLDEGHALWVADIDGDGNDEIFAGHRGKDHRVSVYRFDGAQWVRTIIDRDIAAQDLRGGDLDGDGVADIVAVGGATHNVVWYKPKRNEP